MTLSRGPYPCLVVAEGAEHERHLPTLAAAVADRDDAHDAYGFPLYPITQAGAPCWTAACVEDGCGMAFAYPGEDWTVHSENRAELIGVLLDAGWVVADDDAAPDGMLAYCPDHQPELRRDHERRPGPGQESLL